MTYDKQLVLFQAGMVFTGNWKANEQFRIARRDSGELYGSLTEYRTDYADQTLKWFHKGTFTSYYDFFWEVKSFLDTLEDY